MTDRILHTPEGVRDIYNAECEKKVYLEEQLHSVLEAYGFHDIQTPTFEYDDIFSKERGTIASQSMYRFIDRDGNTLVLRPDITPSIARCVAKYYKDETMPIRLSYIGSTYINNKCYQGKLKETTQLGAELINDPSIDADAEMIALSIECLLKAGLTDFMVEIGEVDFFKGLVEEAGFSETEEEELRLCIEEKNMFAVEELLKGKELDANLKELFLELPELFGSLDRIVSVKEKTMNKKALKAIECLESIYQLLSMYGLEKYITFDLGMLNHYNYYTSIIFRAYTYGTGDAILSGGRYNNLLGQFGKEAPAIGMAITMDQLMVALSRQKKLVAPMKERTLVLYTSETRMDAIKLTNGLRKREQIVEMICNKDSVNREDILVFAQNNHITTVLFVKEDQTVVTLVTETEEYKQTTIDQILK